MNASAALTHYLNQSRGRTYPESSMKRHGMKRTVRKLRTKLTAAKEKELLLIYFADLVLRHFLRDHASLEELSKLASGPRARKAYRALRIVYRHPDKFGKSLRGTLEAILFARKLETRNKMLSRRARGKQEADVMPF